jgi:hypothetical protein
VTIKTKIPRAQHAFVTSVCVQSDACDVTLSVQSILNSEHRKYSYAWMSLYNRYREMYVCIMKVNKCHANQSY